MDVRILPCAIRTFLFNIRISFILEGLIPVALSFVIWKILPNSPETAGFLDKQEKEYIINRLALETGSGHGRVTNNDRIKMHHIWAAFREYKIWCSWVMFWANTIGVYGYTYQDRCQISSLTLEVTASPLPYLLSSSNWVIRPLTHNSSPSPSMSLQ